MLALRPLGPWGWGWGKLFHPPWQKECHWRCNPWNQDYEHDWDDSPWDRWKEELHGWCDRDDEAEEEHWWKSDDDDDDDHHKWGKSGDDDDDDPEEAEEPVRTHSVKAIKARSVGARAKGDFKGGGRSTRKGR